MYIYGVLSIVPSTTWTHDIAWNDRKNDDSSKEESTAEVGADAEEADSDAEMGAGVEEHKATIATLTGLAWLACPKQPPKGSKIPSKSRPSRLPKRTFFCAER